MSWAGVLKLAAPRPVSSNLISFLGQFEPMIYYAAFFIISFFALSFIARLVLDIFEVELGDFGNLVFGFLGAFLWFSQVGAAQMVQYLGLMTNALSMLSAFAAASLLVRAYGRQSRSFTWPVGIAFAGLVLFSAFAKEDMLLFLLWTCLFIAVRLHFDGASPLKAILPAAIVVVAYGLSFAHVKIYGSPFVLGTGPYGLAGVKDNIILAIRFYAVFSLVAAGLLFIWVVAFLLSLGLFFRSKEPPLISIGALYITGAFAALVAPYLVLPRRFEFYAMNFYPLLSFGLLPLIVMFARHCGARGLAAVWTGVIVSGSATALAFHLEATNRHAHMAWLKTIRERSFIQIQETQRAADLGMRNCRTIFVTGVSDNLGPFLMDSARFMRLRMRIAAQWQIVAMPGTILEVWSKSRGFPTNWQYVPPETGAPDQSCRLDFDPRTFRAAFKAPS